MKPRPRIRIENVQPAIDCGRYPVKRTVGDRVEVSATVFRDSNDSLGARLLHRGPGKRKFEWVPLVPLGNDLFSGSFEVTDLGRWQFTVEGWSDRFATWRDELRRKAEGGQKDLSSELAEGELLLGIPGLDLESALVSTVSDEHDLVRADLLEIDVDREV